MDKAKLIWIYETIKNLKDYKNISFTFNTSDPTQWRYSLYFFGDDYKLLNYVNCDNIEEIIEELKEV